MKSKTVIAFAIASAVAWPLAASAHDSARVRTPVSVNETGDAQMHMRDTRFPHRDYMESGSWEVQTPLSVNETAPVTEWSGIANDRLEPSGPIAMTAPSDNETSVAPGATSDELAAEQQSSENPALADQGSDYYLVPVPSDTEYIVTETQPDYYIVETAPSSSGE